KSRVQPQGDGYNGDLLFISPLCASQGGERFCRASQGRRSASCDRGSGPETNPPQRCGEALSSLHSLRGRGFSWESTRMFWVPNSTEKVGRVLPAGIPQKL